MLVEIECVLKLGVGKTVKVRTARISRSAKTVRVVDKKEVSVYLSGKLFKSLCPDE